MECAGAGGMACRTSATETACPGRPSSSSASPRPPPSGTRCCCSPSWECTGCWSHCLWMGRGAGSRLTGRQTDRAKNAFECVTLDILFWSAILENGQWLALLTKGQSNSYRCDKMVNQPYFSLWTHMECTVSKLN